MISRLTLKSFGKYGDRTFELGAVTLVCGPNEAGKSTVFDALAKAICSFRGPQAFLERYGKEAEAKAEYSGGNGEKIDSTEYFGFFAVKSDAISIPFEGDARWMDRVKNSLFSSGVNPQVLAGELEKSLNAAGRKRADKERAAFLSAAESRIASLKADLAQADAAKGRARELEKRLELSRARVRALEARRDSLAAAREGAEALDRYRYCQAVLGDREKLASLKALRGLADETEECRRRRSEAEQARSRLESEQAAREALRKAAAEARERLREAQEEAAARERDAKVASGLCRALEEACVVRETRHRVPGTASIVSLALLTIAGIACGAFFMASGSPPWSFILAAVSGAAAGLLLFLALRKTIVKTDDERPRKASEDAKAEWRRLLPGSGELPGADAAAVLSFLRSVVDAHLRSAERAEAARAAFSRADSEAASAAERLEERRRSAESSHAAFAAWLSARGASSYEEYLALVSESASRSARIAELRASLDERARESGAADHDGLAARVKDELDRLRADWPGIEKGGARTAPQAAALRRAAAELDEAKEAEKALLAECSTAKALAERDAAALLEELSRAESEAEAVQREAARERVLRDAESAAREVFLKMSQSGTTAFSSLSAKVSSYYGSLGSEDRGLALASLDLSQAMVPDASGALRPPRHLSLGTRDIFVLACRLALAESQRPANGILALDEPFKNLDRKRARAALRMLDDFRLRNGYQLVLFTKDEAAPQDCLAVFPREALTIYDLSDKE